MNPNAQKDLLLSTDYPLDKIVRYISGSYTLNPSNPNDYISIDVSDIPYVIGSILTWSYTPDFEVTYTESDLDRNARLVITSGGNVSSTDVISSNIVTIFIYSNIAATIYYRVIIYPLQNGKLFNSSLEANNSSFIINTDNNYLKLFDEDLYPTPDPFGTYTIPHNFGYKPTVVAWGVAYLTGSNYISRLTTPIIYPGGGLQDAVFVNENNLYIESPGIHELTDFVAYRIYIDEQ